MSPMIMSLLPPCTDKTTLSHCMLTILKGMFSLAAEQLEQVVLEAGELRVAGCRCSTPRADTAAS